MIAAVGFAAGLANMTDGNILFDGASLGNSTQTDVIRSDELF